jgi:hypothetical protein
LAEEYVGELPFAKGRRTMIAIRPWAEFGGDFPDDQVEDETGIVRFGGKNVSEAIAEILRSFGCEVSAPMYAGDHGWELEIEFRRAAIWAQITSLFPVYNALFTDWPPIFFSKNNNLIYVNFLTRVNAALATDCRFHDISWHEYDQSGFGNVGADAPVVGQVPEIDGVVGRRGLLRTVVRAMWRRGAIPQSPLEGV